MILIPQVLITLFLLALFHECGHWLAARLVGVAVPHIQLGVGPHLLQLQRGGTRWVLGLFPLGGYTRVHGMVATDKVTPTMGDFRTLHPAQKAIVISAGVLGNVLLACLLHLLVALVTGQNVGAAFVLAIHAPIDIMHGVLALWADAVGIDMPGAPAVPILDGSWLTWLKTTAAASILIALLNLMPTSLTDGGRLLKMVQGAK
jgi:membrane-associated protease RseP (regulator of RpoE activity)